MAYGLSTRVFIEDGPAVRAIEVQESHSTARSWRALDPELRFALVQRALTPANDCIDEFSIAL
jgi:hypothetical protein